MSFTHLHVHSVHSLYHSTLTVKDAVDKAVRLGMNALAITDYDFLYAAQDFVRYSHEVAPSFKPIIGCELHVSPPTDFKWKDKLLLQKAPQLVVLCKNEIGYKNLCKLLEIAWNEGFHICPTVSFEQLAVNKEGLIAIHPWYGIYWFSIDPGSRDKMILRYSDLLGEDYYLELLRNGFPEIFEETVELDIYKDMLRMGRQHNIKVVATNDIHRLEKNDRGKLESLLEASLGCGTQKIPMSFSGDLLKSEEEMLSQFPGCPEAITATEEIVAKIETFEVPQWEIPSPRWNEEEYLKDLDDCRKIIDKH